MNSDTAACRAMWFLPVFITILGMAGACSTEQSPAVKTVADLRAALTDRTENIIVGSDDGPRIVLAPELSARVLAASFAGDGGENLLWVDDTVYDGTYFDTRPYDWNAGGYRTWLAPEDLFFLDADGEWFVPAQLDPTPYRVVEQNEYGATFEADINLKTNIEKYYQVAIRRRISLLDEPPASVRVIADGIEYVGVDMTHSLTNRAEDVIGNDMPPVCLWNLLQVEPSGTALVPLTSGADAQTAYREYAGPFGDRLAVQNSVLSMNMDGGYRSRIGIRPDAAGNGIAYLRDGGDGSGVLYVLLFSVDPQGTYVNKPTGTDSEYGDAVELYNDDGALGGFAEIECHGPARTLARGETQSHTVTLHIFGGPTDRLREIGSLLLGANLTAARYF